MRNIASFAVAATVLGLTAPVSAAEGSANPMDYCKGRIEIFRLSTITPKGTMAGFLKAAADHEAWFKAHGYAGDTFGVARTIEYDKTSKTFKFSEKDVVTVHINPSQVPTDKQDEGYKAFVKEYRDNSDITTERFLCVANPGK
jgi:hypothetical protein